MRRLVIYIGLSVALHVFALWPLLEQQFAVAEEAAVTPVEGANRTVLAMPRLVKKTVVAEPVTPPAESQPQPKSEHQPELLAQAPLPKTESQIKSKLQSQPVKPAPVIEQAKPVQEVMPPTSEVKRAEPIAVEKQAATAVEFQVVAENSTAKPASEPVVTDVQARPVRSAQAVAHAVSTEEVISTQPRFARPPASPNYPAKAKRRQQQGTAWVEVRLSARGQVLALHILRTSGVSSLDQAAIAAVRKWQFLPETRNGVGVPSRVHIPIEFAIAAQR